MTHSELTVLMCDGFGVIDVWCYLKYREMTTAPFRPISPSLYMSCLEGVHLAVGFFPFEALANSGFLLHPKNFTVT